jgi:hypothetical protein
VFGQPVGRLDRRVIQEGEEFVAVVPQVLGKSLVALLPLGWPRRGRERYSGLAGAFSRPRHDLNDGRFVTLRFSLSLNLLAWDRATRQNDRKRNTGG